MRRSYSYLILLFSGAVLATVVIGLPFRDCGYVVSVRSTPVPITGPEPLQPLIASPTSSAQSRPRSTAAPSPPTETPRPEPSASTVLAATVATTAAVAATEPPAPAALPSGFGTIRYSAGSLTHGHGLVPLDQTAYTIDAGQLQAVPLQPGGMVRTLVPPGGKIDGVPVKDWIGLAPTGDGDLWLLDRMGDLARFDPTSGGWRIDRRIVDRFHDPGQLYVAIASYARRAYILDEAQGQIWRWPIADAGEGYFGGVDVWQRIAAGVDVTRAVDVAVDGAVYLLLREEPEPRKRLPARLRKYEGSTLRWEMAAGTAFEQPLRIFAPTGDERLFVVDRDGMRVQALDRTNGQLVASYQLGVEIRAVAMTADRLIFLGRDAIYYTPGDGLTTISSTDRAPQPFRPDDPVHWENLHLQSPLPGAFLPDRDALLPGSPRLYRFGVHEGLDFFGIAVGTPVRLGTPIHAVADGTITFADTQYAELTPAQLEGLLHQAETLRDTPPSTEARLRGREVRITHGGGVVTRYSHLSGIAPGIVAGAHVSAGQVVGYAGNSGVEAGVSGTSDGVHLHFEIRLGDEYLGRWLSPLETRRLLSSLFGFGWPQAP